MKSDNVVSLYRSFFRIAKKWPVRAAQPKQQMSAVTLAQHIRSTVKTSFESNKNLQGDAAKQAYEKGVKELEALKGLLKSSTLSQFPVRSGFGAKSNEAK